MVVRKKTTENEQVSQSDINSQKDYLDIEGMNLAQQIGDLGGINDEQDEQGQTLQPTPQNYEGIVGGTLRHVPGAQKEELRQEMSQITQKQHLTRIGESIQRSSEIRDRKDKRNKDDYLQKEILRILSKRTNPIKVQDINNFSNEDDEIGITRKRR